MTDTRRPKPFRLKPPRVSEATIQRGIVALLRSCGYTVLELGQRRKPVLMQDASGNWQKGWQKATMNDDSTPDYCVWHPSWGRAWLMHEAKGAGTERRPGQIALVEAGASAFITSDTEAVRDVLAFETTLGLPANARLTAWMRQETKK